MPAAAAWIEQLLLGPLATAFAVIAVAATGASMLTGRISLRRGVQAVIGCFILFGAPVIASALAELGYSSRQGVVISSPNALPDFIPPAVPMPDPDPYAGAAVPMR